MDFPLLEHWSRERPGFCYLDSATSTLAPRVVIDAVAQSYVRYVPGVHRSDHFLCAESTNAYARARAQVASFLRTSCDEIVFVRGTTEALNLVAECWGHAHLDGASEVLVTELDHHSNLLPWRKAAQARGAELRTVPSLALITEGVACLERYLSKRCRIVALPHVSNVLGLELDIAAAVAAARELAPDSIVVVDGAQAVGHLPVDLGQLGCDFYAFSGHKMYGPEGIGVLWGRRELLTQMPPYQRGGGMVLSVTARDEEFLAAPQRFEAGTPNLAGALGLAEAARWLQSGEFLEAAQRERALLVQLVERLEELDGVSVVGPQRGHVGLVSMDIHGIHPHDLASIAEARGVAIRAGVHCAAPLLRSLGLTATVRASLGVYSQPRDVEALLSVIVETQDLLGRSV